MNKSLKCIVAFITAIVAVLMLWGCLPQAPYGARGYGSYGGAGYGAAPAGIMPGMVSPMGGQICKAPEGTQLEPSNNTRYLIEPVSNQIEPLPCDAVQSLAPATVKRHDGSTVTTTVIPPRLQAEYVFRVWDNGMNNVRVTYNAYINLGPYAPAVYKGFTVHTYEPMGYPSGKVHQDIADGDLYYTAKADGKPGVRGVDYGHVSDEELAANLRLALKKSTDPVAALLTALKSEPSDGKNRRILELALLEETVPAFKSAFAAK